MLAVTRVAAVIFSPRLILRPSSSGQAAQSFTRLVSLGSVLAGILATPGLHAQSARSIQPWALTAPARSPDRESAFWRGAGIGALAGGVAGTIIGATVIKPVSCDFVRPCGRGGAVLAGTLGGALYGGLVGGIIGAVVGKHRWLSVGAAPGKLLLTATIRDGHPLR